MMPFDYIDRYVADFVDHEKAKKAFMRWKREHYPVLPFE